MRKNSNLSIVAYIGILVVIIGLCAFILFTKQSRVKNFGGEMTYDLDVNQKLIEVTWKDNDLWILTKDMSNNDVAESYTFKESSSTGIFEGTIYINEHKE